ncbi:MAG: hypothetical protein B7Z45_10090, partial [Azorhizobium sp. 12-66-6]
MAFNPISALTGATLDKVIGDPGTHAVCRALMVEGQAVAEKLGVKFAINVDKRIAGGAEVGAHKTSMLQDLERGRPLEIEGRPHGAQHGDIVALILHQHDEAGHDVQRRHQDDEREDQEHDVPLHLQRIEEGGVPLAPVDDIDRTLGGLLDRRAQFGHIVGIVDIDLDGIHVAGAVEIGLRLCARHEHERAVIFGHADLEHRRNLVDLDARRRSHGRHGPPRGHQRDVVAGPQRQLIGEPLADGDPLPGIKPLQRALADGVGNGGQLAQVLFGQAAHQHAAGIIGGRGERLAFHDRHGNAHALELRDPFRHSGVVGERALHGLNQH